MVDDAKPTDFHSKNRMLFLSGVFNEEKAKQVIDGMLKLEYQNPTKDIIMYIDSYGGYIHSLMAIHDVMKHVMRCDVITVGIGKQMSCGQILLMSGTKGKRFATPNSRILMHQLSGSTYGTFAEQKVLLEESSKLQNTLENLVVKYSKLNKTKMKELMAINSYMSAQEALEYGIIDNILTSPDDIYDNKKIKL